MAKQRWILVGGDSLLGKELRDLVAERRLPVVVQVVTATPDERVVTATEDEVALLEALTPELLEGAAAVFLAVTGADAEAARAMTGAARADLKVVDMTASHPAAAVLERFLTTLHGRYPLRRAVLNVFEPASVHGRSGIGELHKQTMGLLGLQALPKEFYDAQVAFNMLPRFGDEAQVDLEGSQLRLEQELARRLKPLGVPLPSLRLLHAPVFHGYTCQAWVEFAARPEVGALEELLKSAGADVRDATVEPPSNTAVAGQSGYTVGAVEADRADARAVWFFLAADNLRVLAEEAVERLG